MWFAQNTGLSIFLGKFLENLSYLSCRTGLCYNAKLDITRQQLLVNEHLRGQTMQVEMETKLHQIPSQSKPLIKQV